MLNVIKYKWIFIGVSLAFVITSVVGISVFGLKRGIDFSGGSLWQIQFTSGAVPQQELTDVLRDDLQVPFTAITRNETTGGFNIRLSETTEIQHQEYAKKVTEKLGPFEELGFETIGAVIGGELVRKALWALFINLFAIALYVAYAFRKVSYPVSSWKYSLITLVTLFHDAIIPLGMMAFLGHFLGVEIDTNFIVATLVVMGFSVHDTIVVFDRIRENLRKGSSKAEFGALVNRSVNETFARSVNTSLTLIVVLFTLFFLGPLTLKYFILVILVGTIVGTYSSIFLASPLLSLWSGRK